MIVGEELFVRLEERRALVGHVDVGVAEIREGSAHGRTLERLEFTVFLLELDIGDAILLASTVEFDFEGGHTGVVFLLDGPIKIALRLSNLLLARVTCLSVAAESLFVLPNVLVGPPVVEVAFGKLHLNVRPELVKFGCVQKDVSQSVVFLFARPFDETLQGYDSTERDEDEKNARKVKRWGRNVVQGNGKKRRKAKKKKNIEC